MIRAFLRCLGKVAMCRKSQSQEVGAWGSHAALYPNESSGNGGGKKKRVEKASLGYSDAGMRTWRERKERVMGRGEGT